MSRVKKNSALFAKLQNDKADEFNSFIDFVRTAKTNGTIDKKHKELILVALGVGSQCEWCIAMHIKNAVEAGCTKEEILDASMLAVAMGGGPKLAYIHVVYEELEKY